MTFNLLTPFQVNKDPCRIWNFDEKGINLGKYYSSGKVIGPVGSPAYVVGAQEKMTGHVSLLALTRADGYHAPPILIVKGRIPERFFDGEVPGTIVHSNDHGGIDAEILGRILDYLAELSCCSTEEPILLTGDGHDSRKHYDNMKKAKDVSFCFRVCMYA